MTKIKVPYIDQSGRYPTGCESVTAVMLLRYLGCDITVDGMEAVDAYLMALDAGTPYDLVCLDIMMPALDGYQALKAIRDIEQERKIPEDNRAKIIMTTALNEGANVNKAFDLGCVAYAGKPIDQVKFESVLRKLELIP